MYLQLGYINIKLYKIQSLHLLHARSAAGIADTFTMKMHRKILANMETKNSVRRLLWLMNHDLQVSS